MLDTVHVHTSSYDERTHDEIVSDNERGSFFIVVWNVNTQCNNFLREILLSYLMLSTLTYFSMMRRNWRKAADVVLSSKNAFLRERIKLKTPQKEKVFVCCIFTFFFIVNYRSYHRKRHFKNVDDQFFCRWIELDDVDERTYKPKEKRTYLHSYYS